MPRTRSAGERKRIAARASGLIAASPESSGAFRAMRLFGDRDQRAPAAASFFRVPLLPHVDKEASRSAPTPVLWAAARRFRVAREMRRNADHSRAQDRST